MKIASYFFCMSFKLAVLLGPLQLHAIEPVVLIKGRSLGHEKYQARLLMDSRLTSFNRFFYDISFRSESLPQELQNCLVEMNQGRADRIEDCEVGLRKSEILFLSPARIAQIHFLLTELNRRGPLVYSDLLRRYASFLQKPGEFLGLSPSFQAAETLYQNGRLVVAGDLKDDKKYQWVRTNNSQEPLIFFGSYRDFEAIKNQEQGFFTGENCDRAEFPNFEDLKGVELEIYQDEKCIYRSYLEPFGSQSEAGFAARVKANSNRYDRTKWTWLGLVGLAAVSYAMKDKTIVISTPKF